MNDDLPIGVTALLDGIRAASTEDQTTEARKALWAQIYPTLKSHARDLMRGERSGHTLGPTGLVHEALLRLFDSDSLNGVPNRAEFFKVTRQAMRNVLVSHARARLAKKRGGEAIRVPLDEALDRLEAAALDVADLHEAVEELARQDERAAQVVTLRFFVGMTNKEVAALLHVSVGTVEKDFRFARAKLHRFLADEDS